MLNFPQLRVRTECSFRTAYGPIGQVADALVQINCKFAGCVDTKGTWAHVKWQKELVSRNITPAFGTEFKLTLKDNRKPTCWVLAENLKDFYNFSSSNPDCPQDFAGVNGVLRFAGAALESPEFFDYIDINPQSLSQAQTRLALAQRTKKPLVLTSDNDYPAPCHKDNFMAWVDSQKITPQHILSESELRSAFWFLDDDTYKKAYKNTFEVAERIGSLKLEQAPIISVPGNLAARVHKGKKYRLNAKHINEWTIDYEERLKREMELIKLKSYESYFLVVADLVLWAKQRMLVGPGRGSSAGSLVCYLLQITEIDPLPHGLLFERFIDLNRNDLPDIDIDFNDSKRNLCFEYLGKKYGANNIARIGSISTLKPRSVMAHVGKKLGIPHGATFPVLNVLIEYSVGDARYGKGLEDTLENTQPGKDFQARYPECVLMGELENHASHTGQHAAGILVSNKPIIDYCTVRNGIAQVDKKGAETLNLLKIDALGLRTLGVIEDANCITTEQLYALKMDDPEVFKIFNEKKISGLFQFEGAAQRKISRQIPILSFEQINHITALARPGPLGGGATNHYIDRNSGTEAITYRHPSMKIYLKETKGVVLYQEQVMRIVREIGQFSWEETTVIRKAMSASKGKDFFDQKEEQFFQGAAQFNISKTEAQEIWNEICYFGAWGMNKSHTTSYAVISYWCAYMKRYHAIDYAAALLRNAKDDDQVIEMLRELSKEGVQYVPFDPELSSHNWSAQEGKLIGGFTNLKGIGPVKAARYIEKRAAGGLNGTDLKALAKLEVKNKDLHPAHTLWGHLYKDPSKMNVHGRIKELANLTNFSNEVIICKLIRKERRDENDPVRVARRGGILKEGQTAFLDLFVVDDSISKPILIRVKCAHWEEIGIVIADKAVDKKDWFLVRGRWMNQFSMLLIKKIKCLTVPGMFE